MNWIGFVLGVLTIAWCTMTAAIYFEVSQSPHRNEFMEFLVGHTHEHTGPFSLSGPHT